MIATSIAPAQAALPVGAQAPDFTIQATLGGKPFQASLADMLKRGPVVLYFYPKAFTSGCTVEAHDFAEAMPEFKALGAQVLGVSEDDIATLNKFSVSECQSAFAVGADDHGKVAKNYDATLPLVGLSNRTSYAIAPNGRILAAYSAMDPDGHVSHMLDALKHAKTR
ncbi:peroxiredoxin [Acetobacteraceae bacterium KSS8]|uniref:thioredoxin-dependent peroxiredoxin n=2 Tax=Endosaccharibacter trunci TaxID=2812733 RepID=A0ABT1W745_9PROT|nr:peroxiredoxin [Acetobacteraceae bacterium KSS8]